MKKQIIITATIMTSLLIFAQSAAAGNFRDRQDKQNLRIQRGLATGQITPREAKKLFRDQRKIRQLRRHYLTDGELSWQERRVLKKRQARTSRRIYRFKHNDRRVQPPWYADFGEFLFGWR